MLGKGPVGVHAQPLHQFVLRKGRFFVETFSQFLDKLINFWQDVAKDNAIGRVYIPQADMLRFGVSELAIAQKQTDKNWHALMAFEVDRARQMMLQGKPLGGILRGRIGMEMRLIIAGGLRVLSKIEQVEYNVFNRRPELNKWDWLVVVKNAI